MSKVVINNCVMKGQHVYEHAVNVGDTYECLPEMNNSNDGKAIAMRSISNEVIGYVPVNLCDYVSDLYTRKISNVVVSIQTSSKSRHLYRLTSYFK